MAFARDWLLAFSVPPLMMTEPWPSAVAELVWTVPPVMVVPPLYVLLPDRVTDPVLLTLTLSLWSASLSEMTEETV